MIAAAPRSPEVGSLLVFSDDWGRHPSSCQHLVRHLVRSIPVTWVNTIGTRAPRFDLATLRRVGEKLKQWRPSGRHTENAASDDQEQHAAPQNPAGLTVVNPKMWPWFSHRHDRQLNQWLLKQQLSRLVQQMPQPVVGLTTLPITADLPDALTVSRWVYYCVDDFSLWPGLDGDTLRRMNRDIIRSADSLVAVSEPLRTMIASEGRTAELLTHGVDVDFWTLPEDSQKDSTTVTPACLQSIPRPLVVFWGVIDRRMDTASLVRLSADLSAGTILLIGPQQDPDPAILSLPNVRCLPPQPMHILPSIACEASVLIMPYADLPVTRAMQPLKLKEYMATGRPVVVNHLPSTAAWSDCLEVAHSPEQFSQLVRTAISRGTGESQRAARQRLQHESWSARAELLLQIIQNGTLTPQGERNTP
jgi:hypothetical protein